MTVEVRLSSGDVALIDDHDAPLVSRYKWSPRRLGRTVYAQANTYVSGARTTVTMHRLIVAPEADQLIDHRNGDGLDNRRSNLRLCDKRGNNRNVGLRADNTSGYKGVHFYALRNRYSAYIYTHGRRVSLGNFYRAEEAAHAYNIAAQIMHGEYARLNDIVAAETIDTRVRAVLREKAGQLADLVQDPRIVAELLGGATVTKIRKKAS